MGRRTLFFIALAGLPVHAAILATWGARNPGQLLSKLLEFAVGVAAGGCKGDIRGRPRMRLAARPRNWDRGRWRWLSN